MRIGHGYDIHARTDGDHVVLGGVRIPCDFGLRAHSDGDVLLHALADALLGAIGEGDIGQLFPDTDPSWRDADSRDLVAEVVTRVREIGFTPVNADLTLIAEQPRIGPYVDDMRVVVRDLLGVSTAAANVKATTHEGVGGLGRGEGIAAHAVVLLGST